MSPPRATKLLDDDGIKASAYGAGMGGAAEQKSVLDVPWLRCARRLTVIRSYWPAPTIRGVASAGTVDFVVEQLNRDVSVVDHLNN